MVTLKEYKGINNPTRYLGGEAGMVTKNSANIRVCVASPDIYENSMSNQTVLNIYNKLNSTSNIWCERVFCPMPDYEGLIRNRYELLSTIESSTVLSKMNIIIFVLDDVMQTTNMLNMLNMARIPILKERREDDKPLICLAGKAVLNPVPFKGFVDLFFIGEVEEIIDDFVLAYSEFKELNRKDRIKKISAVKGMYLGDDKQIQYVISSEFEYTPYSVTIIPSMTNGIELNPIKVIRGCDMPFNMCQDKYIYIKPEEKINAIYEIKDKIIKTGEKDILIDCKHIWDLDNVRDIIYEIKVDESFKCSNISLLNVKFHKDNLWALDYIREVDIPTIIVNGSIKSVIKTIGNSIGKKEIIETASSIFKAGFSEVKLAYTFGTPKESYEDLNQVLDLAKEIANIYLELCPNTTKTEIVKIDLIPFTSYPHTPIAWCKVNGPENLELKIRYIMDKNTNEHIGILTHNQYNSCIKQMILRGDEIAGKIIYDAWKNGAKLDNNEDMFCKEPWQLAIQKNKTTMKEYLDEIDIGSRLPWDNILIQKSKAELIDIFERGIENK